MEVAPEARLKAQMSFLLAADALKGVTRTCILSDGSRCENSAEHSWHVALMAIVLAEYATEPVHIPRVIELLITHDLVEVYAGDTLIYDDQAVIGQAERELAAAQKLFSILPPDQRENIALMWREFEERSTPEARFARAIDALAPTWLHWGEHANPVPDGLRAQTVFQRKREALEPYPALFQMLKDVVNSAVDRGLMAP
jgi:putative hydrolases of HD superfamily